MVKPIAMIGIAVAMICHFDVRADAGFAGGDAVASEIVVDGVRGRDDRSGDVRHTPRSGNRSPHPEERAAPPSDSELLLRRGLRPLSPLDPEDAPAGL